VADQLEHVKAALADRYQIERELGAGGMAVVYLAHDLKHDRQVALKVMRPELSAILGGERFLREIRIAAKLSHPHILALYDSGQAEGLLFYVMPYVEGESLRSWLERDMQLPIHDAITVARQAAGALEYAHRAGVIHRDIKPENILLHRGEAMVADFGIALAVTAAGGKRLTETGLSLGTPEYMSPEQASGEPTVTGSTDVYSLGAVLYEALTGEPPHTGKTVHAVIAKLLSATPTPPSAIRSAVSKRVEEAVMKALAKLPADRYKSAAEFRATLEGLEYEMADLPTSVTIQRNVEVVEREFLLTAAVCRQLNRGELDPRIIGDHLLYLDNQVPSDVLVCLLHGFGGDHRTFRNVLERSPYHCVAVTLYGFEPSVRKRRSLSLKDHITLMRHFLTRMVESAHPAATLLVGFSSGADFGFHLINGWPDDQRFLVDGFLSLGCNLNLDTCFVSSALAGQASENASEILPHLRAAGARAASLGEWLNTHEYLVDILRKFQRDLAPLRRLGQEVIRPFQQGGDPFPGWYREACRRVRALRCVFADTELESRPAQQVLLAHLDTGVLGDCYTEESIVIEAGADHFDLIAPERINRHLAEILAIVC
jgi:serine/threonine protein kinase